jgi:hypothetical protein
VNNNQRTEFNDLLAKLYGGFNMPISDSRTEAYWAGLSKMSLGNFASAVEYALGEHGPDRIPSSSAIWKISNTIRSRNAAPVQQHAPVDRQSRCLMLVNGLFLKYLSRRRMTEDFKGDVNIPERRKACLSLVKWIQEWDPKELDTEYPQIRALFNKAMDGVKDKTTEDWLIAQKKAAERLQITDQDAP